MISTIACSILNPQSSLCSPGALLICMYCIVFNCNVFYSIVLCVVWCGVSGRGGQSSLRFARLRLEKRHNYLRKVAETMTQVFITNDMPNVEGLVLAGSADFKTELSTSDLFDPVLLYSLLTPHSSLHLLLILLYSTYYLLLTAKYHLYHKYHKYHD